MENYRLIDGVIVAFVVGLAGAIVFLAAEKPLRLASSGLGQLALVTIALALLVLAAGLVAGKVVDFAIPIPRPLLEASGAPFWRSILDATVLSSLIVLLPLFQSFASESGVVAPVTWSLKSERVFWGEVALLNIVAHVARYGIFGFPHSEAFSLGNTLLYVSSLVGFTSSSSTSKEQGRTAIRWVCIATSWAGATLQSW